MLVNVNLKYKNSKKLRKIELKMDEMWGKVYCKKTPIWLWHTINRENGDVIAYVIGSRDHKMLLDLLELIHELNFNITAVYSDDNFAYHDFIPHNILQTWKTTTQKI